ncbi:MAG: hypothetical protein COB93_09035 [Sneathiella sp.]|nr:MAG: hypothetical protein COB93_09035 [Sneathiella sp.]
MLSFAASLSDSGADWQTARRDTSGQSPAPNNYRGAIVQVFAARTWGWRGNFATHSWIVTKEKGADSYIRSEVIGWRAYRGGNALVQRRGSPDNYWFGNPPELVLELRGSAAEAVIPKIEKVIDNYPHKSDYRLWPGPNSNSFIAHIGRQLPELKLDLPPTAIGKDFIVGGAFSDTAVSGQGIQLSLGGLAGFTLSPVEGVELHLLGLTVGVDVDDIALKLPGFGRVPLH